MGGKVEISVIIVIDVPTQVYKWLRLRYLGHVKAKTIKGNGRLLLSLDKAAVFFRE